MLKIGVIDSGLGGLSILKACLDRSIVAEYIYIYDNKYHPYGSKDKNSLTAITFLNMEKLISRGCDVILLACNTATSACIEDMRRTFNVPIVGTEPPIKLACKECNNIALLATPYTVHGDKLKALLRQFVGTTIACPDCSGLATIVEYNYNNQEAILEIIDKILAKYIDVDGVVLGCTHYNFIADDIQQKLPHAKIYSSCVGVAHQLERKVHTFIQKELHSIVKIYTTQDELGEKQKVFITQYLLPYKVHISKKW